MLGNCSSRFCAERGEQIELSRFHEIGHAGRGREAERNLSGQDVGDLRRLPAVGHVRHLDVGGERQQHAHQMRHVADAERAVVELAGFALARSTTSLIDLIPEAGLATAPSGLATVWVIGAKSRSGS